MTICGYLTKTVPKGERNAKVLTAADRMRTQRSPWVASCIAMTHLTFELAATHDHWFEESVAKHAFPALKLWWKHFSKQHPIVADGLEWAGCSAIAVALLIGTLIANT
jgi:hypothetical protein